MSQFNVNTAQKRFIVETVQAHTLCVVKPERISVVSLFITAPHLVVFPFPFTDYSVRRDKNSFDSHVVRIGAPSH